jgi:hypothetical protein
MGSLERMSHFLFYAIYELDVRVISQNFSTKPMKAMQSASLSTLLPPLDKNNVLPRCQCRINFGCSILRENEVVLSVLELSSDL